MNHSLVVYKITVHKSGDAGEQEILSDFDGGKSLIELLDEFFDGWKMDRNNPNKKPSKSQNRISCIERKEDGNFQYSKTPISIEGVIDSGLFGTEEDIVDIESGTTKFTKSKTNAMMQPFYFNFYVPKNKTVGYLILQRIGNDGIIKHLCESFKEFYDKKLAEKYVVRITTQSLEFLKDANLKSITKVRAIVIKWNEKELLGKLGLPDGVDKKVSSTTRLTFPRDKANELRSWVERLLKGKDEKHDDDRLFEDISSEDISIEVKLDNSSVRKLNLGRIELLGITMLLPETIEKNDKGYPLFDVLHKHAHSILSSIKNPNGGEQDNHEEKQ
jgi:hypothetical protein